MTCNYIRFTKFDYSFVYTKIRVSCLYLFYVKMIVSIYGWLQTTSHIDDRQPLVTENDLTSPTSCESSQLMATRFCQLLNFLFCLFQLCLWLAHHTWIFSCGKCLRIWYCLSAVENSCTWFTICSWWPYLPLLVWLAQLLRPLQWQVVQPRLLQRLRPVVKLLRRHQRMVQLQGRGQLLTSSALRRGQNAIYIFWVECLAHRSLSSISPPMWWEAFPGIPRGQSQPDPRRRPLLRGHLSQSPSQWSTSATSEGTRDR